MIPIIIGSAKACTEEILYTKATIYTIKIAERVVTEVIIVLLSDFVALRLNTIPASAKCFSFFTNTVVNNDCIVK